MLWNKENHVGKGIDIARRISFSIGWSGWAALKGAIEQRLEGDEGMSQAGVWRRYSLCKGPEAARSCHVPGQQGGRSGWTGRGSRRQGPVRTEVLHGATAGLWAELYQT